jgi:hypothetical protein
MKTIIFMHLHRTGGITFIKLLDQIYDPEVTYAIDGRHFRESLQEFIRLPEEERKKFRIIKGHLFWGLHNFCQAGTRYLAFFRHPIDRAISQYYFHLRPQCLYPIPPDTTLTEFLDSGKFISTDNGMTRFVAGKDREDVEYGQCSRDMLKQAKHNLEHHFLAVGITEYYDQSLVLFKRALGWETYPLYQKKNVNRRKPANRCLSQQERKTLFKYNQYDIELYAFAKKMFATRIQEEGKGFEDEVAHFIQLNKAHQSGVKSNRPA